VAAKPLLASSDLAPGWPGGILLSRPVVLAFHRSSHKTKPTDVWQGTLSLMVLETLDTIDRGHALFVAPERRRSSALTLAWAGLLSGFD